MASPNAPCPCHSGSKYKKCCRPAHRGTLPATPADLMRARYAAFALGLTDYVIETTHPEGDAVEADREAWARSIESFSASTEFRSLDVLEVSEAGDRGTVRFRAGLVQQGRDVSFIERSQFVREDEGWLYHSGVVSVP